MDWDGNEIRADDEVIAVVRDTGGAKRTRWAWFVRRAHVVGWEAGGAVARRDEAMNEAEIALKEL